MMLKKISFALLTLLFCSFCLAQTPTQLFQQALLKENGEGDLKAAVALYEKIVGDVTAERGLRAKAQLHIGMCWEKMGKQEAQNAYQKVIDEFFQYSDLASVARQALIRLSSQTNIKSGPTLQKVLSVKYAGHHGGLISPSGSFIVNGEYTGGLAVYDLVGANSYSISSDYGDYLGVWSADEKYIAFSKMERGTFIKELPDKELKQLTKGKWDFVVKWTERGDIYYYTIEGKIQKLMKTDINGISHELMMQFDLGKNELLPNDFSDDFRYLLYSRSKGGEKGIFVADRLTNKEIAVSTDTVFSDGRFSNDLKYIAVQAKKDDKRGLYVFCLTLNGSQFAPSVQIVESSQLKYRGTWTKNNELCFGQREGYQQLVVCDVAGYNCYDITPMATWLGTPVWSPDGKSICFYWVNDKVRDLWLVPGQGGQLEQLTFKGFNKEDPQWFHQQNRILYIERKGWAQNALMTVTVESKENKQILPWRGRYYKPQISPDDKYLAFGYMISSWEEKPDTVIENAPIDHPGIYLTNLSNNDLKLITTEKDIIDFYPASWTPDGQYLVYTSMNWQNNQCALFVYDFPNDKHIQLLYYGDDAIIINGITPDSKYIRYSTWNKQDQSNYYIISIDGQEKRKDSIEAKELAIEKWSPDHGNILCIKESEQTDFWLARNIESAFANK